MLFLSELATPWVLLGLTPLSTYPTSVARLSTQYCVKGIMDIVSTPYEWHGQLVSCTSVTEQATIGSLGKPPRGSQGQWGGRVQPLHF